MTARTARAALAACLLLSATGVGAIAPEDRAWLHDHPVIRVGLETGYAPFSFLGPDAEPSGISVDYLRLLEQRLGVRLEVAATGDLSVLLGKVQQGELDVLPSLTRTPERGAFLAFTSPYFSSPAVLVVRQGQEDPATLAGMDGRRVAVGRGYGAEEFLRSRHPGLLLVQAANDDASLRLLLSGAADAAVVDLASLSWIVTSTGMHGLRVLEDVGFTYHLSFATRADLPVLRRVLDDALREIPPAEVRRIREAWVHLEVAPHREPSRVWGWLGLSALGVAFLWLVVFGINWALRKEVARRTRDLAASEQRYRLVAENVRDVIWTLDLATGRFTYVSPSIQSLRGLTPEEAMAEPLERSLTPESLGRVRAVMARIGTSGEEDPHTGIYDQPCRDGTVKHVEVTTTLVREGGRPVQIVGVTRDATARVRADEALERTRRTLLMLTRCSEAILRATTEEELLASVCRVIVETGGYRMCWVGVPVADERRTVRPAAHAGHEDGYLAEVDIVWADAPGGQGPTGTALREQRAVVGHDFERDPALAPWRAAARARGYRSSTALPLAYESERIGALTMYSGDVTRFTEEELRLLGQLADDLAFGVHALRLRAARARADAEREAADRALAQERERFQALIEHSTDITLVIDANGVFTFVSPSIRDVLGFAPSEVVGRPARDFVHPEDQARTGETLKALIDGREGTQRHELRVRRADGTWARLEALRRCMLDVPGIRGIVVNSRDITERDRIQEQLRQVQKLESIGRLAGGVAHDFNNLLTVILGSSEELRRKMGQGRIPDPALVDDVIDSARHASELTRQLLAFARKQVIEPVPVDLNTLVQGGNRMLARVIGEDVRTVVRLQPGVWPVRCDPGHVGQVIMNLAVNARDAMPAGGTLTIATENVTVAAGEAVPDPEMAPGAYVRLTVADTGTGMPPEVLEHVFEPFFTTKPIGLGTGLGLATVYGIVKQSGAFMGVRSAVGAGTTFEIFFPRDAGEAGDPASPEEEPRQGHESVLVVEDDPRVRELEVRTLRNAGYRVLSAGGSEEAERVLEQDGGPLDLVLTDVVMPGRGGRELAFSLEATRPGVPVLFVSGYTHDSLGRQGVLDEGIDLLQKPFTPVTLLARVRAALDRGAADRSAPGA